MYRLRFPTNLFALFLLLATTMPKLGLAQITAEEPQDLDIQPTDVIHWTPVQATVRPDGSVTVGLRLQTDGQFSIYRDRLKFKGPAGFTVVDQDFPDPQTQTDPLTGELTQVFRGGDFILTFNGLETYQGKTFPLAVTFLGCTERICLFPYTQDFAIPTFQETVMSELEGASKSADQPKMTAGEGTKRNLSWDEQFAEDLKADKLPLAVLLTAIFLGGLATNLTPCVFPMIPITVRLLGGQNQSPRRNSVLYAAGIILTYTAIGSIVALSGGLFGAILGNLWVNLFFGVIFVVLGLSMLGFGSFNKLQTWGARIGSQKSSALNVFLMGTGAGLVAAPCTGPILGALLVFTAEKNDPSLTLSLFTLYSVGFALPYVFLGMAASRISQFKVSAGVQLGVKILFAAAMFGLAFYYLKTPAYDWLLGMQGYWAETGVALLIAGLLLTGWFLRRPDLMQNKKALVAPTLLLGLGLFAGSQWIAGADVPSKLKWYHEEEAAYAAAKRLQKPILVDGWADWCAACKEMDVTTFQDPRLIAALNEDWVLLKLNLTELNEKNEALAAKYGMPGLPTLVLVPPSGDLEQSRRITGYVGSERLFEETRGFIGK
jgi:thiol:disulfide interchange protein DsbD